MVLKGARSTGAILAVIGGIGFALGGLSYLLRDSLPTDPSNRPAQICMGVTSLISLVGLGLVLGAFLAETRQTSPFFGRS